MNVVFLYQPRQLRLVGPNHTFAVTIEETPENGSFSGRGRVRYGQIHIRELVAIRFVVCHPGFEYAVEPNARSLTLDRTDGSPSYQ
jgi:hypothetical protein